MTLSHQLPGPFRPPVARRRPDSAGGPRGGVDWLASDAPVAYPDAVAFMEQRVEAIRAGRAAEAIWLLEHPALYTAGTSAQPGRTARRGGAAGLSQRPRRPLHLSRPGSAGRLCHARSPAARQRRAGLRPRPRGLGDRGAWRGSASPASGACDRIGIWVDRGGGREAKIAAIGVRVRRWISFHGIAINVDPEPRPLRRHRSLRHRRAWRHLARRSRRRRHPGRRRRCAARHPAGAPAEPPIRRPGGSADES